MAVTKVTGAGGNDLARSKNLQEDATIYRIPLQNCRSNTGLVLDATGGDTLFSIVNGGFGVGTLTLKGEEAISEIETTTLCFEIAVPPEYVAGEIIDVVVEVKVDESGAGNAVTETVEIEAYELANAGTVGGNLVAGGAQDLSGGGDGFQQKTFIVSPAGVAPGDKLMIYLQTVVEEDNGTAIFAVIGNIDTGLDIKG